MDEKIRQGLLERNRKILSAIEEKAKKLCPDSVALIGTAGSFCSGDIHEKSDLDTFIVINDNDGWKVAQCFILGDVAHDIYCTTWEQLEEMAEYNDPYVIKLMSIDFFYCVDEKYMDRYMALRKKLTDKLSAPLSAEDIEKAKKHYNEALVSYAEVMMSEETGICRNAAAYMLYLLEFTVYMLNKEYVRLGVKRVPEELAAMKKKPDGFCEDSMALINSTSAEDIKKNATRLVSGVKKLIEAEMEALSHKQEVFSDALRGSYEEIYSNWKNKMLLAADTGDVYLSFMTMSSCQFLYSGFCREFNAENPELLHNFDPNNLAANYDCFNKAMDKLLELYKKTDTPVCSFESIDEFVRHYLGSGCR